MGPLKCGAPMSRAHVRLESASRSRVRRTLSSPRQPRVPPMSFAVIDGRCIEYAAIPGDAGAAGTLVFLHEGLGSVCLMA